MPRPSHSRAFSLLVLAALVLTATSAHALQVTGLDATNKRGQTYLSWNNLPGEGWKYHVYASAGEVRSPMDFFSYAWEIGCVGDSSAVDQRISTLLGETLTYHTDSAGPPVPPSRGLFVTTPTENGLVHYIVLAEHPTYPLAYSFLPGQNTTVNPVLEKLDTPRPIWQRHVTYPACEDYVLFSSPYDIPGLAAMWQTDGHARHFGVIRGTAGGGLLLHGHGHGGSFFNAIVGSGRSGETVIAPDDYLPSWDASSFYLGYNTSYDPAQGNNFPASYGCVMDYTDKFVLHLIDWSQANLGTDPNRVYAVGSSMGGSFAFFLAWHHPERIAAAIANIPKLCAGYVGDTNPVLTATFERMWSPLSVNLPTVEGTPVFEWMDGRYLAEQFRARGASPVFGFVGRNDHVVGWQEKPPLFQALNQQLAGGAWYWDERTHTDVQSQTTWAPVQFDWQRLYRYRLDVSFPALSNCSANSDPGDGSETSGEAVGTINGFVDWDEELVDTRDRWSCVLRTRTLPTLTGTLSPTGAVTVDVTPRRLQNFLVSSRTGYRYTVTDATTGTMLICGQVQADDDFLITIAGVPVLPGGSRVTLDALNALAVGDAARPVQPRIALASNPVRGATTMQVDWPTEGDARVELLDLNGRRMRTLFSGPVNGPASVALDATGLAPGVYMVHARQGDLRNSQRVVIVH